MSTPRTNPEPSAAPTRAVTTTSSTVAGPRSATPTDSLRAGDRDRDAVTDRLGQALALGYLTREEFDQRSGAALTATTLGDLRALEHDLPRDRLEPAPPVTPPARPSVGRGVGIHVAGYLVSVVVVLVIWLATAIAYGPHYFWPIWPILGGAMGVIGHARPGRRSRCGRPALGR